MKNVREFNDVYSKFNMRNLVMSRSWGDSRYGVDEFFHSKPSKNSKKRLDMYTAKQRSKKRLRIAEIELDSFEIPQFGDGDVQQEDTDERPLSIV